MHLMKTLPTLFIISRGKGRIANGAKAVAARIAAARPAVAEKDFRVRSVLEHVAGGSRAALHRNDPFGGAGKAEVGRKPIRSQALRRRENRAAYREFSNTYGFRC